MKKILIITSIIIIIAAFAAYYFYKKAPTFMTYHHPNKVLEELKEGNVRFVSGKMRHHNYSKKIAGSTRLAHPKAVVLSGMDSQNIPVITFDQAVGDILNLRVAGSVISPDILASMEMATQNEGATLIVVLGNTNSETIKAACKYEKIGNVTSLLKKIQPAVDTAKAQIKDHSCGNPVLINTITRQNVMNMVKMITLNSPVIESLVKKGRVKVVGGIYNQGTGAVIFLNQSAMRAQTTSN